MAGFSLKVFGGMMPRISPRLIPDRNSQFAVNVNLSSGVAGVLKGMTQIGMNLLSRVGIKKSLYRFGQSETNESNYWFHWTTDVDVVRGSVNGDTIERTYYTGDGVPKMTFSGIATTGPGPYPASSYTLGIPSPVIAGVTVTVADRVISSLTSVGTTCTAQTSLPHKITSGSQVVVSGATQAEYNGTFTATVVDSTQFTYTAASAPSVSPATGAPAFNYGGTVESRVYGIGYVSNHGEEGIPSLTGLINVTPGQTVTLSSMPSAPAGAYDIGKLRLYRTVSGSNAATLRYLADDTLGASYVDSTNSSELGENCPTLTYSMPPSDMFGLTALPNGGMAGISGNQVCLSVPYQPHAWPVANRYSFDMNPVAIGSFGQSIVVLTNGMPSVMTGVDPSAMSQELVRQGHPCMSAQSVVEMAGGVAWVSDEGIAFISGQGFSLLTAQLFTRKEWALYYPSTVRAYRWRNCYVGFYDQGWGQRGFVFDFDTSDFYELDFYADAGYTDPKNGNLYLANGDQVMKFDDSTALTMVWKSKVFVTPKPVNMGAAKVIADGYPVTFQLIADGALKPTINVTSSNPFRLHSGYLATDWEVQVYGTHTVSSITVAETLSELKGIAE